MFHLAAQAGDRKSWGRDFSVYVSNNVGIATAWVDASRRFYVLPDRYRELLRERQIPVPPLPDPDPLIRQKLKVIKLPER